MSERAPVVHLRRVRSPLRKYLSARLGVLRADRCPDLHRASFPCLWSLCDWFAKDSVHLCDQRQNLACASDLSEAGLLLYHSAGPQLPVSDSLPTRSSLSDCSAQTFAVTSATPTHLRLLSRAPPVHPPLPGNPLPCYRRAGRLGSDLVVLSVKRKGSGIARRMGCMGWWCRTCHPDGAADSVDDREGSGRERKDEGLRRRRDERCSVGGSGWHLVWEE